ncbi:MAG: CUAEP/CCAEP-tail radical SAM protein [bacterium]
MKAEGRVLLLSCYELGHSPMGLALPLAALRQAGFHPATQDLSIDRLDADRVHRANFVGISVPMHTALRLGVRVARHIRQLNSEAHICFYGLYAGLNAAHLLDGTADSVIGGEYREPLLELIRAIDLVAPPDLDGVSTPKHPHPARIAKSPGPPPSRQGLPPLERHARLAVGAEQKLTGYAEATSGCKHLCLHCPIPAEYQGRFFAVPIDLVMKDVAAQVEAGARHITFGDPDFLNGPTHARRLIGTFHDAFPEVTFDITAKVEHLLAHRSLLPVLADSGCLFIVTAVETLNDRILAILHKGHTRADFLEALPLARQAGIALRPTWLPFTPWSTLEDYCDLLHLIRDEGLVNHVDPVQFAIRLLVPARSPLLDSPDFAPFKRPFDPARWAHPWTHPDPRMDDLQAEVAALVETHAKNGAPAWSTFNAVLAAAYAAAGASSPQLLPGDLPGQPPAPALTEPWFC